MEKEFVNEKLGGDGGKVIVGVDKGDIKAVFSIPVLKLVEPLRAKLKEFVPGDKFDGYVDTVIDGGLLWLGIVKPAAAPKQIEE